MALQRKILRSRVRITARRISRCPALDAPCCVNLLCVTVSGLRTPGQNTPCRLERVREGTRRVRVPGFSFYRPLTLHARHSGDFGHFPGSHFTKILLFHKCNCKKRPPGNLSLPKRSQVLTVQHRLRPQLQARTASQLGLRHSRMTNGLLNEQHLSGVTSFEQHTPRQATSKPVKARRGASSQIPSRHVTSRHVMSRPSHVKYSQARLGLMLAHARYASRAHTS